MTFGADALYVRPRYGRRVNLHVLREHPRLVDGLLAAALVVAGEAEAWSGAATRPVWIHALLTVPIMGSLAWRRRFPLAVLAVVVAGVLALDPEAQFSIFLAAILASYTAGAEVDRPRAWAGLVLAVGPFWVGYTFFADGVPSDYVATAIIFGGSWAVGQAVRERGRRADQLAERAERLEREREEEAERAVARERARIARELHDIVSHSISVIAVQSQAVRRRLGPEQVREADDLRAVETTARQAMAEMRRLFGVLRADGERPSLAPQPGLDQLERLLAETRAAGVPVELRLEGERIPLPPGVDLAAYRVVQEALTNVRKHAGPARASVTLRFGERELELAIEDDGTAPPTGYGGYGLLGMRERVAIYGGTLEAGPRPEGGFVIRATLPFREEARM